MVPLCFESSGGSKWLSIFTKHSLLHLLLLLISGDAVCSAVSNLSFISHSPLCSDLAEVERASILERFRQSTSEWSQNINIPEDCGEPGNADHKSSMIVVTDACLPSIILGEGPISARVLINYELPTKKNPPHLDNSLHFQSSENMDMDACFGDAREDDALFMEIEWRLLRLISEGEDEDEDGGGTFDSRNPFHTAARTITKFEYHGNHHHQPSVVARSRSAMRPINGTGVFIPAASLMSPITTIVDRNQKKPPRRRRGAPRGVGNQKLS